MPSPSNYSTKREFLRDCIPMLIDEGKSQKQAFAICNSMWENRFKKTDPSAPVDNSYTSVFINDIEAP